MRAIGDDLEVSVVYLGIAGGKDAVALLGFFARQRDLLSVSAQMRC